MLEGLECIGGGDGGDGDDGGDGGIGGDGSMGLAEISIRSRFQELAGFWSAS